MEQENKNWEQPEVEEKIEEKKDEVIENNEDNNEKTDGSQYGKFKDAESLLDAYNNLQAEFTRKCQRLSELEKSQQELKAPVFSKENWQDKVSEFINSHSEAKKFASEISQEILTNPSLQSKEDALELAWAKVIGQKYKPVEDMVNDEKFVNDYVLSSEQIKQKVLQSYIDDLNSKKIPPFVTTSSGGDIAFTTSPKAATLSEAKTLVEAIFNVKKEN